MNVDFYVQSALANALMYGPKPEKVENAHDLADVFLARDMIPILFNMLEASRREYLLQMANVVIARDAVK